MYILSYLMLKVTGFRFYTFYMARASLQSDTAQTQEEPCGKYPRSNRRRCQKLSVSRWLTLLGHKRGMGSKRTRLTSRYQGDHKLMQKWATSRRTRTSTIPIGSLFLEMPLLEMYPLELKFCKLLNANVLGKKKILACPLMLLYEWVY